MSQSNDKSSDTLRAALKNAEEIARKEFAENDSALQSDGQEKRGELLREVIEHLQKALDSTPSEEKAAADGAETKTLHLAITMAGAISAGAYTAGVVDYLLEVLDKWADLKAKGDPRVPTHDVKIEVLSGASAGGMTAAITSIVLHQKEHHPITTFNTAEEDNFHQKRSQNKPNRIDRRKLNRLYNSWVNLTDDQMMPVLLADDKELAMLPNGNKSSISALNSDFIQRVAGSTVEMDSDDLARETPLYVSDRLRLFVTLTNLDGFPKNINFGGGGNHDFTMFDHRDAALFRFADYKPGEERDGSIRVDFADEDTTALLRQAAMATGAFPIGLAYRTFSRQKQHVVNNVLLRYLHGEIELPNTEYRATFIDGGLINNEPFELTQLLLRRQVTDDRISRDCENFNSTVLMIDPFPSEKGKAAPELEDLSVQPYGLFGVVGKLVSVLRTQVLVKPNVIQQGFSADDYTLFIIAPRRREDVNDEKIYHNGSRAIACGTLGGFGGFLDKKFREHDFYLGRINCKSFLQSRFKIPADTENPIFKGSFPEEAKRIFQFRDEETGKEYLPMIPDVNKLTDRQPQTVAHLYRNLAFPDYSIGNFKRLRRGINRRINYVINTNVNYSGFKWYIRPIIKGYLRANMFFLRSPMFGAIYKMARKDITDWKLIRRGQKPETDND